MKKILFLLIICLNFLVLVSCGKTESDNPSINIPVEPDPTIPTPTNPTEVDMRGYWKDEYGDDYNQISSLDLVSANIFHDGQYLTENIELNKRKDNKYEFYTDDSMRFINSSDGYAITIPSNAVEIDYSIAKYRVQLSCA